MTDKLEGNQVFITTVSNYLNDSIDPKFFKQNVYRAWDLALTSNLLGDAQKKAVKASRIQQKRALTSLKLKPIPLQNLASKLRAERKSREEQSAREHQSLSRTASYLGLTVSKMSETQSVASIERVKTIVTAKTPLLPTNQLSVSTFQADTETLKKGEIKQLEELKSS